MLLTRLFKAGDDQAVRIPCELAYSDASLDVTITRSGDVITIYPARKSLKEAVALSRAMPKPPDVETYDRIEMPERARD
jgi:antitoxin VapB